jgi:hypothetical protein
MSQTIAFSADRRRGTTFAVDDSSPCPVIRGPTSRRCARSKRAPCPGMLVRSGCRFLSRLGSETR